MILYRIHIDADAHRMTVVAVHPDSESLELHLEVGRGQFRSLAGMITLRHIEVYGRLSDKARTMLEQKAKMLGGGKVTVHGSFAGFVRTPAAHD
jgi:hypothetical protein